MPDLLTHAGIGALLRVRATRSPLVWFVVGSCLPDLASRLFGLGIASASWIFDFRVSVSVLEATGLAHVPLPYLVLCLLLALLLPRTLRTVAFANLALGGLLHFAVDTLQTHLNGGYYLLYPFSMRRMELAWIDTADSLEFLPWLAVGVGIAYGVRWWWSRRVRTGTAAGGST